MTKAWSTGASLRSGFERWKIREMGLWPRATADRINAQKTSALLIGVDC